ncbi:MAG: hypothetical protein HC810_02950 [Acaryochloridaceae cyanobacterium RL_2_7]|nr:hypothetical protein [Acaryochloridaceae cyanobacterium RL_2_7]
MVTVWRSLLEMNGGEDLHSGASLTKAATTLAVLHRYDLNQRFQTKISRTGEIENGVLKGDLIIEGGMDLLLMPAQRSPLGICWSLEGIKRIAGNLVVLFPHQAALPEPDQLGTVLREGMNAGLWSAETLRHYQQHLAQAPKPSVEIAGSIQPFGNPLSIPTEMMVHQSPTVLEMVKYMNLHSSNDLAEALTADMGGMGGVSGKHFSRCRVCPLMKFSYKMVRVREANRMTPRAAVGIFMAIQNRLSSLNLDLKDAFPMSGTDIGTLEDRNIPKGAVVKTGTLWNVSALAGYIPTEKRGGFGLPL